MFDALVTRAIAHELNDTISQGRVQAVLALDPLSVGFEIYAGHARRYLLASAEATTARLYLVSEKLRAGGEPPGSFILLLKKYTDGALVNRVEATPRERIVRIEFDHAEEGVSTLVVEVMGRHSNLILLDATGAVLDAIKRVTPAMSRARAVLPRMQYLPPPPQAKADPLSLSPIGLGQILEDKQGAPLWQALVGGVAGTSPLLGRELAYRVTGRADAVADPVLAPQLVTAIQEVWRAPAIPTLAYDEEQPVDVAAFALTHRDATRPFNSMSVALEQFFGATESYAAVKAPLRAQLETARDRLARKRASLEREIVPDSEVERIRTSGELILAHVANIKPGAPLLRAEMIEGEPLAITLDPELTPVENAQRYFARYRRAKDAAASVPARLAEAAAAVEYADQVLEDLAEAETRDEIEAALAEAREVGLLTETRARRGASTNVVSGPRSFESPDGLTVLAGRNARQNEEVTFSRASAGDLWLHVRGAAGAHVVILSHGRPTPERTIEFAAGIAAFYSRARQETWADVIVTLRKNVRRVTGRAAHPGLVTVREERNVRVRPWKPEE
ncbi:MAG: NFACT RNA binding domain-containing protein [Anaerolineae bacterium]